MPNRKRSKLVVGCCVTILLGAIGSGLWNVALGPALSWTGNALLTAVSFGIEAVKNGVYAEVARGLHEKPGLSWLGTFTQFLLAVPFVFLFFLFLHRPVLSAIQRNVRGDEDRPPRPKRTLVVLCLLMLFCCSFFFVEYLYVAYSNRAITHFRQSLAICAPYLAEEEEERILSEFAQVGTKQDYVDLVTALESVASKAGKELPRFKPW